MKSILLTSTLCAVLAWSNLHGQGVLKITVKNIRNMNGTIRVALFSNEDTFLKTPASGMIVKAAGSEVTVTFENLAPGEYGISAFHDENENAELDSNLVGMPKEGFAFGNNSMGMFGPPDFEKAKVLIEVKKVASQTISLKYL
jgi:uncharacterized protein (DUF2141 family)